MSTTTTTTTAATAPGFSKSLPWKVTKISEFRQDSFVSEEVFATKTEAMAAIARMKRAYRGSEILKTSKAEWVVYGLSAVHTYTVARIDAPVTFYAYSIVTDRGMDVRAMTFAEAASIAEQFILEVSSVALIG